MTFNAYEASTQLGKPVELYEFMNGMDLYRYTSADHDVEYEGETFIAYPLQRTAIATTAEKGRNNLQIKGPRNIPIADIFRVQPPSDVVTLTVYRYHEIDPDAERIVLWVGRVLNVKWDSALTVTIYCEPITVSLERPGLRRLFQRQCPHVLYGNKCGMSGGPQKIDYAVSATITAADGITLTSAAFDALADNYLAGGFIEYELPSGNIDRRFIATHVGADVGINFPSSDIYVGMTVTAYPGCDHTLATCNSKFSNSANYGGMPFIPQKDPMDGSSF